MHKVILHILPEDIHQAPYPSLNEHKWRELPHNSARCLEPIQLEPIYSWCINRKVFLVSQGTLAATVTAKIDLNRMTKCLVVWYVLYVSLSCARGSCQCPLVRAAQKAKRLNSRPGETNCGNVWPNELRISFRYIFSFSGDLTCRASQQNQLCTVK